MDGIVGENGFWRSANKKIVKKGWKSGAKSEMACFRYTVAGVCSSDSLNTKRNSNRESKLEFSWLQEQTPATAQWPIGLGSLGDNNYHPAGIPYWMFTCQFLNWPGFHAGGNEHRDLPLQERRTERSRTVCSCDHMNTKQNSNRESKLEFSWLHEQTPATAKWPIGLSSLGENNKHPTGMPKWIWPCQFLIAPAFKPGVMSIAILGFSPYRNIKLKSF
jgi:hypothetical protein